MKAVAARLLGSNPVGSRSVCGLVRRRCCSRCCLYLAISLGFQRVLVMQRAHRLQLAGPAAVAEPRGTG